MGQSKNIELTITQNYVKGWDFKDAIRELIQNGVDQQTLDPENVFEISYDEMEEILQLSNSGSTLEMNTLLLGCSTKTDNTETVGQFGEGYKIAALVLNRIGKSFSVYNNNKNEIWTSKFEQSSTFNEKVLMFEIIENRTSNAGLTIEIENVTQEEYDSLFDVWLGMPGAKEHNKIETEYGSIFTDPDMKGKIFVNGLSIESKNENHYGYDFKPQYITLERDRKSCNNWNMNRVTGDMICEAVGNGDLDTKEIMDIANNEEFSDISLLQYKVFDENAKNIRDMFISEFDKENNGAIPVGNQSDYDKVKKLGGKAVFVPYTIANIISDTTDERIERLKDSVLEKKDYSVKEKLQQWRDFYEDFLTVSAIEQFNQIIDELE